MADFAFNNGSFGMAFEPLRDEGPPAHGGFRPSRPVAGGGVELREARAFSTPVAGHWRWRRRQRGQQLSLGADQQLPLCAVLHR